MRMSSAQRAKLIRELLRIRRAAYPCFNDKRRLLPPSITQSHQGTPAGARMLTKHLLARFGVQHVICRLHPLRFSAAEPQAPIRITITAVAHAVPDRGRGG